MSDGSGVSREAHAPFCERPKVQFLRPTLHVFDLWAARWRRHEATGDMILMRYADDIVAGFEHEADARRFWDDMCKRFEEFSLSLNPDKTRLLELLARHVGSR